MYGLFSTFCFQKCVKNLRELWMLAVAVGAGVVMQMLRMLSTILLLVKPSYSGLAPK